jgi:hypothetical protein
LPSCQDNSPSCRPTWARSPATLSRLTIWPAESGSWPGQLERRRRLPFHGLPSGRPKAALGPANSSAIAGYPLTAYHLAGRKRFLARPTRAPSPATLSRLTIWPAESGSWPGQLGHDSRLPFHGLPSGRQKAALDPANSSAVTGYPLMAFNIAGRP